MTDKRAKCLQPYVPTFTSGLRRTLMPDNKKRVPYHAYLLRCWQEGKLLPGERPRWRFSLEGILHERSRQRFDDLEALLTSLQTELANSEKDSAGPEREIE